MVAIKNFFKVLVATSIVGFTNAIPTPNTAEQVVNNLNTAAASYGDFYAAVQAFSGQTAQWGTVKAREAAVEVALTHSIAAARASAHLTDEGSQDVMAALGHPYPNFMADLLNGIVAKKTQFAQVGKKDAMLHTLQTLKVLSDELPDALEQIVDATHAGVIQGGKVWVDGLFDDAIGAFAQ
ncbi:cell wall mannoprotein 1 family protein [Aspergillus clavatus NRRL 1]|uniref:Cell wall protein, putative n=1 Tax=Aspergillus clavatus (strain ATCC 1007 / CBS 513.65 / DSM 816 / NCTC 3887 / NRRL 1 / QM 1276 / 107) TaxID=344612 RepID=A1CCZ5_ASPCL|nr:cell wall protein, putative [Aspergillus clavatus NRRL 1]EAW12402.1 cell wall protein, putative [Aspergillus clavatus NRRL 1]